MKRRTLSLILSTAFALLPAKLQAAPVTCPQPELEVVRKDADELRLAKSGKNRTEMQKKLSAANYESFKSTSAEHAGTAAKFTAQEILPGIVLGGAIGAIYKSAKLARVAAPVLARMAASAQKAKQAATAVGATAVTTRVGANAASVAQRVPVPRFLGKKTLAAGGTAALAFYVEGEIGEQLAKALGDWVPEQKITKPSQREIGERGKRSDLQLLSRETIIHNGSVPARLKDEIHIMMFEGEQAETHNLMLELIQFFESQGVHSNRLKFVTPEILLTQYAEATAVFEAKHEMADEMKKQALEKLGSTASRRDKDRIEAEALKRHFELNEQERMYAQDIKQGLNVFCADLNAMIAQADAAERAASAAPPAESSIRQKSAR